MTTKIVINILVSLKYFHADDSTARATSKPRYNYTYLDQLHISPVNSTHRVLQKISLHHHSILFASARKKHFEVRISLLLYVITEKHRTAKHRSRKL